MWIEKPCRLLQGRTLGRSQGDAQDSTGLPKQQGHGKDYHWDFREGVAGMKDTDHRQWIAELSKDIEGEVVNKPSPDDRKLPNLYLKRADAYCKVGEYAHAIADCNEAMVLAGESWYCEKITINALHYRGLAYRCLGDNDAAIADFTRGLELFPNLRFIYFYLYRAGVYCKIGEYYRAIADCSDAVGEHRRRSKSHFMEVPYLAKGDNDIVIADFTEAIELHPDVSVFYYCRGLAYLGIDNYGGVFRGESEENYQRAIADFSDAIRLGPDDEKAH
jgi:tetratricopeptide (TPR) repeat protein